MEKRLTIIGGGITGLTAAYIASKAGWDVTVIEASPKMGGLLNTFSIGGTRLEHYYHHFFTHDSELLWLCEKLGLTKKLVFHKSTMGVFRNNTIYDFNGPFDLLNYKPMSFIDKLQFGLTSLYLGKFAKWENMEALSAMDWFYKYAGKGATESLWKPMLNVKFGPYAKKVPIAWMIGRLSQRMNSRKGVEEQLGYLDGSLQILLDALLLQLKKNKTTLITDSIVQKIQVKNNTITSVSTSKGEYKGGLFLSTIPTIFLTQLMKDVKPNYAKELSKIEYFGAVCVILELKKKLSDIYWLNVADPGFPFGGVIEHTNLIPASQYKGSHIVYLSRYFDLKDKLATMSNEEIQELMIPYLKKIYPHFKESDIKNIFTFKTRTAATVCDLNFSKKVPHCHSPINNLYISSMPHIYPDERSCNNSIRIAAEACRVMGIDSSYIPHSSSLSGKIGMK